MHGIYVPTSPVLRLLCGGGVACTVAVDGQEGQPRHVRPGGQDQLRRLPRVAGTPDHARPRVHMTSLKAGPVSRVGPFVSHDVLDHLRAGASLWSAIMVAHSRPRPVSCSTCDRPLLLPRLAPVMSCLSCRWPCAGWAPQPHDRGTGHSPQAGRYPGVQGLPTAGMHPTTTPAKTPHGTALLVVDRQA